MNYVEHLKLLGVDAKQIPCITGEGEPSTATEGAIGCLYMNTLNGDIYKCISINDGNYIWENLSNGSDRTDGVTLEQIQEAVNKYLEENPVETHTHNNKGILDKITLTKLTEGIFYKECTSEEEVASLVDGVGYRVFYIKMTIDTLSDYFYIFNFVDSTDRKQIKLSKDGLFVRDVSQVLVGGRLNYMVGEWQSLSGNVDLSDYATTKYVDDKIGDIETALDSIIAIQNELMGGDSE